MRIVYLGTGQSIHALRWARALAGLGHEVHFVSQQVLREPLPECASVTLLPVRNASGYLLNRYALRRLVRRLRPDVLHANYATGYGTLARLAEVPVPTVLTVWGSDVYDFPRRGRLFRALLRRNLRAAAVITSASAAMAAVVEGLLPSARVVVVPFGVDTTRFQAPEPVARPPEPTIGTVKGLDPVYGIDLLLRAYALLRGAPDGAPPARLVIAGEGSARAELQALARSLGLERSVEFLGRVPHADVPALLGSFTVYVALSRRESFGVAVAEASACGVPVVVSDVGGLPEVVVDGVTGEIVPAEDPAAAARAIRSLLDDPARARAMGAAGRDVVRARFEWRSCVERMVAVYASVTVTGSAPRAAGVPAVSGGISIQG